MRTQAAKGRKKAAWGINLRFWMSKGFQQRKGGTVSARAIRHGHASKGESIAEVTLEES